MHWNGDWFKQILDIRWKNVVAVRSKERIFTRKEQFLALVLLFDSILKSFYKKKYYTSIIDRGNNVRVIREEFRDNSWSNNNPIIILTDRI